MKDCGTIEFPQLVTRRNSKKGVCFYDANYLSIERISIAALAGPFSTTARTVH
jgi:hypothetical protein